MVLIKFDTDEVREQLAELDRAKQQLEQQEESTVEPIKEKIMQNLKTKSEVNEWLDMQSGNEIEIIKNISSMSHDLYSFIPNSSDCRRQRTS